tara:strand:+ start:473 stop:946 length:474 start_codon:yes stop_codon:yes gene_type:complete
MVEVDITEEMICLAKDKVKEMGNLNNSILNGSGSLAGFIGEQIFMNVLGGEWKNTYDYDVIISEKRIDVKTKQTTVKPKPYYDCSVASYNTKQDCDAYAFVRVKKDLSVGWLLGIKPKDKYFKESTFMRKGEVDPSNNFTVRADCYNLRIDKLDESL